MSIASLPLLATATVAPASSSNSCPTCWLKILSSTSRMDAPRMLSSTSGWTASWSGSRKLVPLARRAVNQNVLPSPSRLSTPTVPPISSASCLLMTSPSPVPPYLRVVEVSAWWKDWNRLPIWLSVMPMPSSCTSKRTSVVLSRSSTGRARMWILPFSENLMALLVKFSSTCSSRSGSPRSWCDRPGHTSYTSSSPLRAALSPSWLERLLSSVSSAKSATSSSILPASILEKSRMSLMMPSKCWLEWKILPR